MGTGDSHKQKATDSRDQRGRLHLREVVAVPEPGYGGVGAELRATRQRHGIQIATVAQSLRINLEYLQAIEDGRFSDLPGHVYTLGFLRSYAEFLELDPDRVVGQHKSEALGPPPETRLEFPEPMDANRLPTGRILAVSLLVALFIYAGWFFVTQDERETADAVSPVPERLAAVPDSGSPLRSAQAAVSPAAGPETARAAADPAPLSQPDQTVAALAPPAANAVPVAAVTPVRTRTEPVPATDNGAVATGMTEPSRRVTESTISETTGAETAATETPSVAVAADGLRDAGGLPAPVTETRIAALPDANETAPVQPAATPQPEAAADAPAPARVETQGAAAPTRVETQIAAAPTVPSRTGADIAAAALARVETQVAAAPTRVETQIAAAPTAPSRTGADPGAAAPARIRSALLPPPLATDGARTGTRKGQTFGAANTDARIVLVSVNESWIQVRGPGAEILLTGVLRPGDRYLVPNRPGLVMMMGNAGAIRIFVDGETVPKAGPDGAVLRNVALDPGRLRQGTGAN